MYVNNNDLVEIFIHFDFLASGRKKNQKPAS